MSGLTDDEDEPFELAPAPPMPPKKQRSWLAPLAIGIGLLIVYAGSTTAPEKAANPVRSQRPAEAPQEPWRAEVLAELEQGETIKEAIWSASGSLWLGVLDDGGRRDGLAQYACEVFKLHRPSAAESVIITVWDIAKMTIARDMVQLGKHHCR